MGGGVQVGNEIIQPSSKFLANKVKAPLFNIMDLSNIEKIVMCA